MDCGGLDLAVAQGSVLILFGPKWACKTIVGPDLCRVASLGPPATFLRVPHRVREAIRVGIASPAQIVTSQRIRLPALRL